MVKGTVGCNEFIVASLTDPPRGQALTAVGDPSAHHRVVALSLEGKETEAEGPVMAFAMYALPAIAGLVKVTSYAVTPASCLLLPLLLPPLFRFLLRPLLPINQTSSLQPLRLITGVDRQP